LSEATIKKTKALPGPLPEGEHVLWQRSPHWRALAKRPFQLDKLAIYFALIVGWVAVSAFLDSGEMSAVARSLTWALPPALGVLGLVLLTAWLYARTTVYTITNRRIVIQTGLALDTAVNLPFTTVNSADIKTFRDGTGDIEITMGGPRLLYSMIWPHVRFLRLNRPAPVLRALESPDHVADVLSKALAADQPAERVRAPIDEGIDPGIGRTATS
jgi:hypothetical protein